LSYDYVIPNKVSDLYPVFTNVLADLYLDSGYCIYSSNDLSVSELEAYWILSLYCVKLMDLDEASADYLGRASVIRQGLCLSCAVLRYY
jgi:hypothetical protein